MIKKTIYISLSLLLTVLLWNCEKDDICSGLPTTPKLVIAFYDAANPSAKKTIANLKVVEENNKDTLVFNGKDVIKLPLKTNTKITSFLLIFKKDKQDTDKLEFNYTTEDIYVSRACGYKTLFTLNGSNGVIHTPYNGTGWIKNIQILKTNIINEKEPHIKIFF